MYLERKRFHIVEAKFIGRYQMKVEAFQFDGGAQEKMLWRKYFWSFRRQPFLIG